MNSTVMSLPPDFPLLFPPQPPSPPHLPLSPYQTPSSIGETVAAVAIACAISLLIVLILCGLYRNLRARADAITQATAAVAAEEAGNDEQLDGEVGRPRQGSTANLLPALSYSRSLKHNITGGDEGTQCSVCLADFQLGEAVRLLPMCMHLYHVECIDMWLAAHSTCPICRSETDQARDHRRAPV